MAIEREELYCSFEGRLRSLTRIVPPCTPIHLCTDERNQVKISGQESSISELLHTGTGETEIRSKPEVREILVYVRILVCVQISSRWRLVKCKCKCKKMNHGLGKYAYRKAEERNAPVSKEQKPVCKSVLLDDESDFSLGKAG